jgi:hypothetical protein
MSDSHVIHLPLDRNIKVGDVPQDKVDEPLQPILAKVVFDALRGSAGSAV